MLRRVILVALVLVLALALVSSALADNPSGTGPPNQSCEQQSSTPGGGNSSTSPGSPFTGGTSDDQYSPRSQYDVACYQVSNPPGRH